ncbi:MAG: hypothetical protein ACP6IY_13485 [Promethearchaeia archaeon]
MNTFITLILSLFSINEWKPPWEPNVPPEELFEGPSLVLWVFAWIFLCLGLVALAILIIYARYGRELSIKLYTITIILSSIFLGFAFHFFLLYNGYW